MSWREATDHALTDLPPGGGTVQVRGPAGAQAEVEVRDADRIGVRVGGLRLRHHADRDVVQEAHRLARELRALPERVEAQEVDAGLGGAILRSRPERPGPRDFWEVRVEGPREVEVRRHRIGHDGQRSPADFDLTREQLGRLLGELEGDG